MRVFFAAIAAMAMGLPVPAHAEVAGKSEIGFVTNVELDVPGKARDEV